MLTKLTRYVPTVVVLAVAVGYVGLNVEQFEELLRIPALSICWILLAVLAFFLSTGFTFYLLVDLVAERLSPAEWIGLTFLTNFGNYLGPARPGSAIKAVYLKSQKRLPYSTFTAVLAANSFVALFMSSTVGLVLLTMLWLQQGVMPGLLFSVCTVLLVVSLAPFFVKLGTVTRQGRIWRLLNNATLGFETIKRQKRKLVKVCVSMLLQYCVSALLIVLAYRAIGHDLSFTMAFIIGVFTSISNLFTITPNNIGVQEVVMAYLYTITGLDFASGLQGASLIRGIHILVTFGLTPVFTHVMLRSANLSLSAILPGAREVSPQRK